jgi:hypothetical protein
MRKASIKTTNEILEQNFTVAMRKLPYEVKFLQNLFGNDPR